MIDGEIFIEAVSNGYVVRRRFGADIGRLCDTLAVFNTVECLAKWLVENFDLNKAKIAESKIAK